MKTREIVIGGLLTALAIMIPLLFRGTPLQLNIPPFTMTLASHVPTMLAMFISPWVAAMVGIGSTLGFAMTLPAYVALRASTHIVVGVVGAHLYLRGWKPWVVLLAVLPLHAVLEALAVIAFGWSMYQAWVVVGAGTAIHHAIDSVITLSLIGAFSKAGLHWLKLGKR